MKLLENVPLYLFLLRGHSLPRGVQEIPRPFLVWLTIQFEVCSSSWGFRNYLDHFSGAVGVTRAPSLMLVGPGGVRDQTDRTKVALLLYYLSGLLSFYVFPLLQHEIDSTVGHWPI